MRASHSTAPKCRTRAQISRRRRRPQPLGRWHGSCRQPRRRRWPQASPPKRVKPASIQTQMATPTTNNKPFSRTTTAASAGNKSLRTRTGTVSKLAHAAALLPIGNSAAIKVSLDVSGEAEVLLQGSMLSCEGQKGLMIRRPGIGSTRGWAPLLLVSQPQLAHG